MENPNKPEGKTMRNGGKTIRVAAVIVAIGALTMASGCGSSSKGKDALASKQSGSDATSSTVPGAGGGTGSQAGKGSTATTAKGGSTPTTAGSTAGGSTTKTTYPPVPMKVTLAADCVRPGGVQTITIETIPDEAVGYGSIYSDGKGGMDAPEYGGNNAGKSDPTGKYVSTWTVGVKAPPGPVKVTAFAAGGHYQVGKQEVTYKIANAVGKCP